MSDAEHQPDPSMEEILESIRRIISEDGEEEEKPELRADSGVELLEEGSEDDIYELTNFLDDEADPEPFILDDLVEEAPVPRGRRGTTEHAGTAVTDFSSSIHRSQGIQLGEAGRTLEDLVRELLRPMLKDWLDKNLEPIVTQAVEREITKLAGLSNED